MRSTVLSDDQVARINNASLEVLDRTGVVVPHPEMLRRLAEAGARVDLEAQRVRIPGELVMRLVAGAGKRFTYHGRDISRKAEFGCGKRNYNSIGGEALWIDEIGGPRRYPSLADVATAARFADALKAINIVGSMADPHEIPIPYRCVEVMATMLRNTTKPLVFWFHDRASARYLVDMMIAVRGSEQAATQFPLCYLLMEPISPLRFPFHGIDLLFETARVNLPAIVGPMAQMGLSAPMSIAATMVQENAEILAGICMTQLVRPGMPVCYGGICHAFDMRTTQMIFSGPEQAILGVGMTQLGKSHGFPVYINVGMSDAKRPDAQAGLESAGTLMVGAAAGADVFGHFGICGVDQATSLDMLVMHDEVCQYVDSAMRELDLSDEALGVAEIDAVGPGGNYIDRDFTAQRFRGELHFPALLDRNYYQAWIDGGALSMEERCRARKEEILATHRPEPVSDELGRALDEIVAAARREIG